MYVCLYTMNCMRKNVRNIRNVGLANVHRGISYK